MIEMTYALEEIRYARSFAFSLQVALTHPFYIHISGSAYKIVSNRAYHHGTMLISTRLDMLGDLLRVDKVQCLTFVDALHYSSYTYMLAYDAVAPKVSRLFARLSVILLGPILISRMRRLSRLPSAHSRRNMVWSTRFVSAVFYHTSCVYSNYFWAAMHSGRDPGIRWR